MSELKEHEYIIEPNRNWVSVDWREILGYRDLLYLLVRRDFVSKYKQTILGPVWFVVQPLLTTAVFVVIFARVARISTDGLPPILFYLSGLLIWSYFAQSATGVSTSLTSNANLFNKVYFPRLVVPISMVVSNLIAFCIQFAVFLSIFVYYKYGTAAGESINPGLTVLTLPLLVAQALATGLGIGLIAASLTAKYRDLTHLTSFLIQLGMYATPIIYPLSVISEKWRPLVALNPLSAIVESLRYSFFGTGTTELRTMLVSVVITLVLLLAGVLLFNRAERTFVDTV